MATEMKEVTALVEEIKKGVSDIQDRHEKLEAKGIKTDEGLEKIKDEVKASLDKFDELKTALEAEQKSREELEKALARIPETGTKAPKESTAEYKAAFVDFLGSGGRAEIPDEVIIKEIEHIVADMGQTKRAQRAIQEMKDYYTSSNPDGGYMVPVDMRNEIIRRVEEYSPMRALATTITTGSNMVQYPVDDDLSNSATWVDELDTRSGTDSQKFAMLDFPVHELYAEPKATNGMLEDSQFPIESYIRDQIARQFAKKESTAFISGDGVKRPKGVLTYAEATTYNVYERGKIGWKETATNDTLAANDLIKFQFDLLEDYQANARWMMNRAIFAEIATFTTGTGGDYLINPRILFEGVNPQLLGKPVAFSPDMASTVADAAKVVLYGDFMEGYLIIDRLGITILRDPYTDKRYVKFSARKRVGGGVKNFQAIKGLKIQ